MILGLLFSAGFSHLSSDRSRDRDMSRLLLLQFPSEAGTCGGRRKPGSICSVCCLNEKYLSVVKLVDKLLEKSCIVRTNLLTLSCGSDFPPSKHSWSRTHNYTDIISDGNCN